MQIRMEYVWQKVNQYYFIVKTVDMNRVSGWDNVLGAGNGILLWRSL